MSLEFGKGLKLVAIGGGTGLSTLLSGLKIFVRNPEKPVWLEELSAIVAVSDDGGSSGRLRDEFQVLPPGDIRNCIVALSEDSLLLSKLFKYRFRSNGELGGHSFGNLFLIALTEITGDFTEAIKLSSEILATKGHIYPATTTDVRLIAELENGSFVKGETNISKTHGKIKRLKLEPENCKALPEALKAIEEADLITIGPGSLYTSLLPPLLVKDIAEGIEKSKALKIFICNLMTQPGETDGYSAQKHLEVIYNHVPSIKFDYLILNNRPISQLQAELYAKEGAEQIDFLSINEVLPKETKIIAEDLLDESDKVRHNPEKLALSVLNCFSKTLSKGNS
ncbi:MAG: YvcK family protein [Acidobacteria bacterium]|jgi:uncharacterized cofD-like protein|nr:MAG: YvcK family protein [Acidobacteriota bacterium]GIU82308.1 MAG: hypothetical protein KatS3mg006_1372 [Pyrinomonadaceae bacterium]